MRSLARLPIALLLIVAFAPAALAWNYGSKDLDGDGVPNAFDNCKQIANAGQGDADADGIGDLCDNCTLTSNTGQLDADGDGFGNRCDADFDGDGLVTLADFGIFKCAFGSAIPSSTWTVTASSASSTSRCSAPACTCLPGPRRST